MPRSRYGRLHSEAVHGRADLCSPGEMDGVSDSSLIKRQTAVGVSSNSTALDSGIQPPRTRRVTGRLPKEGTSTRDFQSCYSINCVAQSRVAKVRVRAKPERSGSPVSHAIKKGGSAGKARLADEAACFGL